jgi:ABC-type transport system involved in cytochrome bd biosynthesis fused ATPase/permease subunit
MSPEPPNVDRTGYLNLPAAVLFVEARALLLAGIVRQFTELRCSHWLLRASSGHSITSSAVAK